MVPSFLIVGATIRWADGDAFVIRAVWRNATLQTRVLATAGPDERRLVHDPLEIQLQMLLPQRIGRGWCDGVLWVLPSPYQMKSPWTAKALVLLLCTQPRLGPRVSRMLTNWRGWNKHGIKPIKVVMQKLSINSGQTT